MEPGKINFDLLLDERPAETAQPSLHFTLGESQRNRPSFIVIGRSAFLSMSPQFLRGTLAHEAEHAAHHMMSIKLIEEWRRSRESRRIKYNDWLIKQSDKHRISLVEYELAIEQMHGGHKVTQVFAYLQEFMSDFHSLKVEEAEPVMEKIIQIQTIRLSPLSKALSDVIVSRLREYYCTLDASHRAFFDQWVNKQLSHHIKQDQEFYQEMSRFKNKCRAR